MGVEAALVLTCGEVAPRLGQAASVDLVGQLDEIVGRGQAIAQDVDPGDMVVPAHMATQCIAPQPAPARYFAGISHRHDADALEQIAPCEIGVHRTMRVFGNQRAGDPLVRPDGLPELSPHLHARMRHEVTPNLTAGIGEAVDQQKPRRLDCARAQKHVAAALALVDPVLGVDDGGDGAGSVALEARDEAAAAHLRAVRSRQGHKGHVHARLSPGRAAGLAKAAVGASRSQLIAGLVPRRRQSGVGGGRSADAEPFARPLHQLSGPVQRQGRERIGRPWRPPRIVRRSRDAEECLEFGEVRLQVVVTDRPVDADAELAVKPEIIGLRTRRVSGVVKRRSAHANARVVLAEHQWIGTVRDPLVEPE